MSETQQQILITLAMCTHNHADRLKRTLEDIRQLEPPINPWEILIIDNASTDETPKLLAASNWHPPGISVRIIQEPRLGISYARNCASQNAKGKYVLYVDDDETPNPKWIRAHEQNILTHEPDALAGPIHVLFEHGERPSWLQDELLGFLGNLDYGDDQWLTDPATHCYTGNLAVKNKIFAKIGGFDTDLGRRGQVNTGGEDTEFYRRLIAHGCKVRWVADAIINHRIHTDKLRRRYFLELHYHQGMAEGSRCRGNGSRIPPKHLFGQLARSIKNALQQRFSLGKDHSLRLEMNTIYFLGYIRGWTTK